MSNVTGHKSIIPVTLYNKSVTSWRGPWLWIQLFT